MEIKKILVANRGEIALRIMRSAKEMGIKTVAVYSEADRAALHVQYADEAVCIGPAASAQSYLRGDKIIEKALKLGVDAIHPGYGFLSENSDFCRSVTKAGIIFIGPPPEAMDGMGLKLSAKATAKKCNVPLVPGTDEAITDIQLAKKIAIEIGFPVLIKASAGGGGKGMRIVDHESHFEEMLQMAQSEAQSSFGNNAVFIEKYVVGPRHIEIQLLGDKHGNMMYLFERECSIQRRYQKVIEEAPSSCLTPAIRKQMGECAVRVAKEVGYYNAGTVEFLVDINLDFYFLEMNTRLQVEHPVSEIIVGLDLVKEQIKIAQGEKLAYIQEDLKINGHALEVRVYAEDPANNFLPDIGTLQTYQTPQGNGVRVDDAYIQGMEIPIYYDPMIAKLITHGVDRNEAISKMIRAIDDYRINGIETTLSFCKFVLKHEAFVSGNFDTGFIKQYFKPEYLKDEKNEADELAAVIANMVFENNTSANEKTVQLQRTKWKANR
ncbi:MAG TPA: acetyl-CoA carboxylase biotin carboxylase subunit [Bacteroidia bacterium]|nr:acetyl-CoA carboxylase biotin carboxylase subunit [Bacteroidia bacterium]